MTTYGVFLGRDRVGALSTDRARLAFAYTGDAARPDAPALSVRLPTRAAPYEHEDAHPFFANLLPEDEYGALLSRVLGLSERNVAGMLGAIGGECAGAVSIWPEGQHPPETPEYVSLDASDMRRLLDAANAAERMDLVRENRLSLAGTMEKLGLRRFADQWYRGRAGAPTTHILKWPQSRFPDQSYNEVFCLDLCRFAGLDVPLAHVEGGTTPVLVVERYDRRAAASGTIALVHQEDFCQASGLDPKQKYQAEGGPGLDDCARIIRRHCVVPAADVVRLLEWAFTNYLIGNADAHAKNLSLLHDVDGLRLAPFYDITCTIAYGGLTRNQAMEVGGECRFAYVEARHWERLADDLDLPAQAIRRGGLDLADRFERSLPTLREELAERYGDQPIFGKAAAIVTEQIALLREHLPPPAAARRKRHTGA
jgi:serine/threonine-protein kinase HipA